MKFEGSGSKGTLVIEQKRFSLFKSLWPWPLTYWPKINRGLLLNKGYHLMKFEGSGSKGTWVIERKRSVTDGQTDGQPDGQGKNNMSPPKGGRHNY